MARLKEGEPACGGHFAQGRNPAEKLGVDYGGTRPRSPGRIIEKRHKALSEEGRIITKAAYGQPGASSAVTGSAWGKDNDGDAERAAQ